MTPLGRRDFLKMVGAATATAALPAHLKAAQLKAAERARDRPNIVFILADDMGYGDLTCPITVPSR